VKDYVAVAETTIDASTTDVWRALTDPALIERYMFGSKVTTDWRPGSSIVWKGEYDGKEYEDRGEIVEVEPEHRLVVTHSSPSSGSESHHTVTYELEQVDGRTRLTLEQDGNATAEAAEHSRANWETMLAGLKEVVEAT